MLRRRMMDVITCDGCPAEFWEAPGDFCGPLRNLARDAGWSISAETGDHCPACVADGKLAEARAEVAAMEEPTP